MFYFFRNSCFQKIHNWGQATETETEGGLPPSLTRKTGFFCPAAPAQLGKKNGKKRIKKRIQHQS